MDPNRRWADIPTSRQQAFIPETPRVTDSYWRRDMLADQPTSAYPTVVPGARTLRNPRSGVDVLAPKKGAKRRPRVVLLTSLLIAVAVIGISSLGGWGYLTFVAHRSPFSKPPTPAISHTQPTQTPVPPDEQSQAKAFGKKYMDAFLQQHYDVMWSMLSSPFQTNWSSQDNYATYLQAHFKDYTLQSFSLGQPKRRSYWINSETMTQYNDVIVVPVSLHLLPKLTGDDLAKLAPQFQQPDQLFQNLPLILLSDKPATVSAGQILQLSVLGGGPTDPESPILPPSTPVENTAKVPILMYHYVTDAPPTGDINLKNSLTVTPTVFGQQLDFLKQQNYHSITFNQLMNALYYKAPLPSKPIIFTFDDGYEDAYTFAYPILKTHGYSGMFYIITGKVGWGASADNEGQANWDQLREMLDNGMQIGSHTQWHHSLNIYAYDPQGSTQEVQIAQTDLQTHLGIAIQHFCYPNGDPFKGNDTQLQKHVVDMLASLGYIDATTDPGPTGTTQDSTAPFVLLRLRIDGRSSLDSFIATFS